MNEYSPAGLYSGTSNIVLPLKQSQFPPEFREASRLSYYASLFSSVEINATFYRLPQPKTVLKWSESVPEGFRFTFKVPKTITHVKGLGYSAEEVERFGEVIAAAKDRKGCVLVQLPPSLTRERQEELEGLLECLSGEADGWPLAVEFRHLSWYDRAVYRMLSGYGATLVGHDMLGSATPVADTGSRVEFLRFHGPEPGYRGDYETAYLQGFADRIAAWIKDGKEVYAYFNNTLGNAFENLQTLNELTRQLLP